MREYRGILIFVGTLLAFACSLSAALAANNAQYIGDSIPATMIPGFVYNVSVTMKNTGTTTWTKAGSYRLGAVGDSDPFAPGRVDLADADSIAPSQQKTFSFTMTAPISEGVRTSDWNMLQENVQWFGDVVTKVVNVTFGPNPPGAPTISWPTRGMILGSNRPDVKIQGDPADIYEVHIGSLDTPTSNDGWDSGQVSVTPSNQTISAASGVLNTRAYYYVFARLHNPRGWGPWSAFGCSIYTDGQLLNEPYDVAGPIGGQWVHTICFNPDRNEYLVAYYNLVRDDWRKVSYYRLDSTGARIGDEVTVVDDIMSGGPNVCYNSGRKEYLIAYGGYTAVGGLHTELRLQRVNASTGALVGGSMRISTPNPARQVVAYSPTSDHYLLAYEDSGQIFGLILDSTAAPIGGAFNISNGTYVYSGTPRICYNSTNDEFFVPWVVNTNYTWDAYAQRVRASDGALLGGNITIGNTGGTEFPGGVAYDNDLNRYLVVCDGDPSSPWVQFISASGSLIGARIPAAGGDFLGGMSGIAWNPIEKEYLVTWSDSDSASQFGRRLTQSGGYIGEPFRTNGNVEGFGNWDPKPVFNTVNDEYLIAWYWQYDDVYVRRYKTCPAFAPDSTAPSPVTNLTATSADGQLTLNWTNPSNSDFSGTMVLYKTGSYPSSVTDGTVLGDFLAAPGSAGSYVHTGLTNTVTYYYSAFPHDFANYGSRGSVSGIPADVTPPGPVSSFTAAAAGQSINLAWNNPADADFTGTMIRFKNTGYPTSKTDGWLLVDKSGSAGSHDTYVHSGVGNSVYYYAAFAHDEVPNYSTKVTAQATPDCMADQWFGDTFDTYTVGNLGGQGSWTRTGMVDAQVQSALVKFGKGVIMDTVTYGGPIADQVSFTAKNSGYYYCSLDIYADSAGTNLQEIGYVSYQTSAGTEIARLHIQKGRMMVEYGSGANAILTTSAANATWYNVKIGFNVDARTMDLWLDTTAKGTGYAWKGSGTGFGRVVIGSDRNATLTVQKLYADNLNVDIRPSQIASVTDDGAWSPSASRLHFVFDPIPCASEYRYAIGSTSGETDARGWTSVGVYTDVMATGLSLTAGQMYYVSVQIGTGHGTYGASTISNGIKIAPAIGIQLAKVPGNGTSSDVKALRGKLVSAVVADGFYVQEPDAHYGMKVVSSASVAHGDQVDVCGVMKGAGAERYLDCSGNPVLITSPGPGGPYPVVMIGAALGGTDLNANTPGVVGGRGLNNIGSFVTAFGKVTQRQTTDPKYFYIDDGSGVRDGTTTSGVENVGVRVIADPASYMAGSYVCARGILSCFDSSGLRPQVLPVSVQALMVAP
jgi:hypothetical protein